jgi:hypothetical protein
MFHNNPITPQTMVRGWVRIFSFKTIDWINRINSMKRSIIALSFITSARFALALIAFGQQPQVTLYAPGPIPTAALVTMNPAFTPDGKSVYLGQRASSLANGAIMSSQVKMVHGLHRSLRRFRVDTKIWNQPSPPTEDI